MRPSVMLLSLITVFAFAGCGELPARPVALTQQDRDQTPSPAPISLTSQVAHLVTERDLTALKIRVRKDGRIVASECGDAETAPVGAQRYRITRSSCEFGQRSVYVIAEAPLNEAESAEAPMEFAFSVAESCAGAESLLPQKLDLRYETREAGKARHVIGFGVAKLQLP